MEKVKINKGGLFFHKDEIRSLFSPLGDGRWNGKFHYFSAGKEDASRLTIFFGIRKNISLNECNIRILSKPGGYLMSIKTWPYLVLILLLVVTPVLGGDLTKIYGSVPKNGINQVTLDNSANEKEAVIVFKELNWPIPFAVYVPPHQTGVLNLPSESYQVYYSLGYGWNDAEKRFINQPEYFMVTEVLNAGTAGTVHDVKTQPQSTVVGQYRDEYNVTRNIVVESDPAEWTWAESTIPLYQMPGSSDAVIPIDENEFPLS